MATCGRRVSNYVGHDQAANIYASVQDQNPGQRDLSWTLTVTAAVARIMVDGLDPYEPVRDGSTTFQDVADDARRHIEIWECSPQNWDEDLTRFASGPLDRVELAWAEASDDPHVYRLYRGTTSGVYPDPPIATIAADLGTYTYTDGPVEPDNTYYWKIVAEDEAGNTQDSNEVSKTVDAPPDAPTNFDYTHNNGSGLTTFTWTASAVGATGYNFYEGDPPELTGSPTDLGNVVTTTDNNVGVTGRKPYLLRAYDGTGEEAGLAQMVWLDLSNGVEVARPNSPYIVSAQPVAGGEVEVKARYDGRGSRATATSIRMYSNDGAGGAVDWVTPVGTVAISSLGVILRATVTSSGLAGEKTYLIGIRARTAGGVEDDNTDTTSVVTDATAPGAPTLTATLVN